MSVTFYLEKVQETLALYLAKPEGAARVESGYYFYYLRLGVNQEALINDPESPANELTFKESWQYNGCYLFSANVFPESQDLLDIVKRFKLGSERREGDSFESDSSRNRYFAWWTEINRDDHSLLYVSWVGEDRGTIFKHSKVFLGNVELQFQNSTTDLHIDYDNAEVNIKGKKDTSIMLYRYGASQLYPENNSININCNITDNNTGLIFGKAHWNADQFYTLFRNNPGSFEQAWGGELRYFYKHLEDEYKELIYPVSLPPANRQVMYLLDLTLDALNIQKSLFIFQNNLFPDNIVNQFVRNIAGQTILLTPLEDVGFYLARRPYIATDYNIGSNETEGSDYVYLAPVGKYVIGEIVDDTNKDDSTESDKKILCGLSGTEFIQVSSGDYFEFVPAKPAYANQFNDPKKSSIEFGLEEISRKSQRLLQGEDLEEEMLLTDEYTTSWLRYQKATPIDYNGYYAQPNTSVNYDQRALGTLTNFGMPVASFVDDLQGANANQAAPSDKVIPMVFYGGIFPPKERAGEWPNKNVTGQQFSDFEKQVLTTSRHQQLIQKTNGPVFFNQVGAALDGGRTTTPQGLLVSLNDKTPTAQEDAVAGSWNKVYIAKHEDKYLSFNANPVTGIIDPVLSNSLTENQLFLVMNNWAVFTNEIVSRTISVDGFNFEITPNDSVFKDNEKKARQTIIVYKYSTTQTLVELVNSTESWAEVEHFIGPHTEDLIDAQETLLHALKVAKDSSGQPSDPFKRFRERIMDNPLWTGLLSFNCPINGNGMPPDLQMLFAGINGGLQAHHFGVEVNQIEPVSMAVDRESQQSAVPDIKQSALFGVIQYPSVGQPVLPFDPEASYQFIVENLEVIFLNSHITDFHSRIAMKMDKMLGRDIKLIREIKIDPTLSAPVAWPNTIYIDGKYQREGKQGRLVFESHDKQQLHYQWPDNEAFVRIIDYINIKGANLAPISPDEGNQSLVQENTKLAARFAVNGEVVFARNAFKEGNYFNEDFVGIDLFSYGAGEGDDQKGMSITNLALRMDYELNELGQRPIDLPPDIAPDFSITTVSATQLATREEGLANGLPIKLGSFLGNIDGIDVIGLGAKSVNCIQLGSNVTTKPQFALRFDLPLGSLGSLSEVHASIDASLILGWGPCDAVPDNDGVAIYIQLPTASGGAFGYELQGLVQTTFGAANLGYAKYEENTINGPIARSAYVILFNNVAIEIMGIKLPPRVVSDFILFSDPTQKSHSNIGWSVAATEVKNDATKKLLLSKQTLTNAADE